MKDGPTIEQAEEMIDQAAYTGYSLRARHLRKAFGSRSTAGSKHSIEDEATVAVGLKPTALTKQERQVFGSRVNDYLCARSKILLSWWQDCSTAVNLRQLLAEIDDSKVATVRDAYYFLQENGYINFGVLTSGEPEPDQQGDAAAADTNSAAMPLVPEPEEDDRAIVFKLYQLLRAADMQTTSEKAIRKELQKHFKTDISTRKALVKQHVNYFIEHLERKDSLEPLGYEGQADPYAAAAEGERERERRAAASAARAAAAKPPDMPHGRVIVVGAGPAGLAAANVLQRNNVDVLVLEARDRVGGRVHSYTGPFSAPVDLGTSVITGTAPEVDQGLAPDPVIFLCRQMGLQLQQLQGIVPIYGAAGQQVSQELQEQVDRSRDDLLDQACHTADTTDQEQVEQLSLGEAVQQALQQHMQGPSAAPAAGADATATGNSPAANGQASEAAATSGPETPQHMQEQQQPQQDAGDPNKEQLSMQDAQHPEQWQEQQPVQNCLPQRAIGEAERQLQQQQSASPDKPGVDTAWQQPAAATVGAAIATAPGAITADWLQLLDWQWANFEYGCNASLDELSLQHWDQDGEWGGFGGPHCMVVGGLQQTMQGLAAQLGDALRLSCPVTCIRYSTAGQQSASDAGNGEQVQEAANEAADKQQRVVKVTTAQGEVLEASLVLVTVPLGVLKQGGVKFVPALPEWKQQAVQRMGFGNFNKVVLQFPTMFWHANLDCFSVTQPKGPDTRGRCFIFWNLARVSEGAPLLAALVSGKAAQAAEAATDEEMQEHALQALRRVYGDALPAPLACHVTRWASDKYTKGGNSYVALGCSGAEYDTLAQPVGRSILFAGEHTCKEHPSTVGGAMLSGMREAAHALHLLRNPAEADAAYVSSRTETISRTEKRKCMQGEDAADDAEAGRLHKKHKKKKKEKKEKRDKKDKRKNKNKQAEAEAEAAASGDEQEKQGVRRGRERRPPGVLRDEAVQRVAARQHIQQDVMRLWHGLLDAQQGNVGVVTEVLASCDSLDARQQCMTAIMRASAEAIEHLSNDAVFLATMDSWLADLVLERSDANLHVLHKVLELLAKLVCNDWEALSASGLLTSIKQASNHRRREVSQLAASIAKEWAAKDPNRLKSAQRTQQQQQQRRPASAQQQQQRFSLGTIALDSNGAASAGGAGSGADGGEAVSLSELLPVDERQELEATEAALREAHAQAEAAAAQLAALQQEMPVLPASGRVRVDSFIQYSKHTKRAAQDALEEEQEMIQAAKRAKQQITQQQRPSSRQSAGSSGGAAGAGGSEDPKELAAKLLREFVKAQLKPRFQRKELDSEDCKWLLNKVQEKVMANTTALEVGKADNFMNNKREAKVIGLLDSYVVKRKMDNREKLAPGKRKSANTVS